MGWAALTPDGWRARRRFACVCTTPRRLQCPSPRRNSRSLASGEGRPRRNLNPTPGGEKVPTWERHRCTSADPFPWNPLLECVKKKKIPTWWQLDPVPILNRIKLTLEGVEEEEEDEEEDQLSPSSLHKMTTTLEISMISANGYKSRHSQPECGYALEPSKWTEYSIHTMDPDNLELTFEFFEVIPPDPTPQNNEEL